jgi:hypothetical protein
MVVESPGSQIKIERLSFQHYSTILICLVILEIRGVRGRWQSVLQMSLVFQSVSSTHTPHLKIWVLDARGQNWNCYMERIIKKEKGE